MRRSLYILTFFFWVAVLSCGEEGYLEFPSKYVKTTGYMVSDYRVFTRDGEVSDNFITTRLKQRDTSYFNYMARQLRDYIHIDTVKFIDASSAKLVYWCTLCSVELRAGKVIFTRNDIVTRGTYIESFTHHPSYWLLADRPDVLSEKVTSSVRGYYTFNHTMRDRVALKRSGSNLMVPVIFYTWRYANRTNPVYDRWSGQVFGHLQPDFFRHMGPQDTLSFQLFEVSLIRAQ